jgi:inorganic pyrophosphatase
MTHPWHDLPNNSEHVDEYINAVIEIPRGSKVKYEIDKPTGLLRVDRILHTSSTYPANYGFLPRTYCDDNDPLDVLVLGSEPIVPMSIVRVRPIGVMRMVDDGEQDDKVIGVLTRDPAYSEVIDLADLPPHILRELRRFFEEYKILENKEVQVDEFRDAEQARAIIRESIELYRREEEKLRGW